MSCGEAEGELRLCTHNGARRLYIERPCRNRASTIKWLYLGRAWWHPPGAGVYEVSCETKTSSRIIPLVKLTGATPGEDSPEDHNRQLIEP
jgi:hypothetical protein